MVRLRDGERFVTVNGVRHWLRVAGAACGTPPLVVIHGGPGGNTYNFERTVGARLERFATVLYYDQRGCGRSASPQTDRAYSIELLVADLDGLRNARCIPTLVPLGFSFGGQLALEYALRHPERTGALVLQAPSVGGAVHADVALNGFASVAEGDLQRRIREISRGAGPPGDRLAEVWRVVDRATVDRFLFHQPAAAALNRRLWEESGLSNTGAMERALEGQPGRPVPLLHDLGRIAAPALVMVGRHDRNVGIQACREVARALPDARLVVFEHSAHFPDIEEPAAYAGAVRAFLRERAPHPRPL